MITILRNAGFPELVAERRGKTAGTGLPVHGRSALASRRHVTVPGHQGGTDLSPRCRIVRCKLVRENYQQRPTARHLGRTASSFSVSRMAEESHACRRRLDRASRSRDLGGQRLNSPNDVDLPDRWPLYFSDPPYGVEPRDRSFHFQGVYALRSHS